MAISGFLSGNYREKLAEILARSRARLPLTNMKWFIVFIDNMLLLGSCSSQPPGHGIAPLPPVSKPQQSKESVRGTWLAMVSRLDWSPVSSVSISSPTVRTSLQQKVSMDKLDNLKRLGISTIFLQVKPDGIALWKSKILSWSDTLTGTIGQDPGYDPLKFMLGEAHRCGMKVRARPNPYRISVNTKPLTTTELNSTLSRTPSSVYVLHRDWIRTAGRCLALDPGIPDMRGWIISIVAEVAENYPADGMQFDDYSYTESPDSALSDSQTFRRYDHGFASKTDWWRDNTRRLIAQISRTIKKLRPEVKSGVSPADVWCNRSHDPAGSDTRDAIAHDELYANTRRWM